jgi:hypothetical protein
LRFRLASVENIELSFAVVLCISKLFSFKAGGKISLKLLTGVKKSGADEDDNNKHIY